MSFGLPDPMSRFDAAMSRIGGGVQPRRTGRGRLGQEKKNQPLHGPTLATAALPGSLLAPTALITVPPVMNRPMASCWLPPSRQRPLGSSTAGVRPAVWDRV